MTPRKNKLNELENTLFLAHRKKKEITVSEGWQKSVMNDIRNMETLTEERVPLELFSRFAWRFSAAAIFAVSILLIYVSTTGFIDYQELAMQFLENPLSYIL